MSCVVGLLEIGCRDDDPRRAASRVGDDFGSEGTLDQLLARLAGRAMQRRRWQEPAVCAQRVEARLDSLAADLSTLAGWLRAMIDAQKTGD